MPSNSQASKTQHTVMYGALVHQEKVLLLKRSESESYAGQFELPGGKIEFSENPERCLVREFQEETGLIVDPFIPIKAFSNMSADGDRQYVRVVYLVEYADETREIFLSEEHDEYVWADAQTVDEMFTQMDEDMFLAVKMALEISSKTVDYDSEEDTSIN